MMRFAICLLAASLCVSCASTSAEKHLNATGTNLAKAQAAAATAKREIGRARDTSGPAKEAHLESALDAVVWIQAYVALAGSDLTEATKRYWSLYKDYNSFVCRRVGWANWRDIKWIIGGIVGFGIIGMVAQLTGWGRAASFIFGWFPAMNPFKYAADRVEAARAPVVLRPRRVG